jgi:hypothetical protein
MLLKKEKLKDKPQTGLWNNGKKLTQSALQPAVQDGLVWRRSVLTEIRAVFLDDIFNDDGKVYGCGVRRIDIPGSNKLYQVPTHSFKKPSRIYLPYFRHSQAAMLSRWQVLRFGSSMDDTHTSCACT